jgi:hypothetical protein
LLLFVLIVLVVLGFILYREGQEQKLQENFFSKLNSFVYNLQSISCNNLDKDLRILKLVEPYEAHKLISDNKIIQEMPDKFEQGILSYAEIVGYEKAQNKVPNNTPSLFCGAFQSCTTIQEQFNTCKGQRLSEGFHSKGFCTGYVNLNFKANRNDFKSAYRLQHILYRSFAHHKENGTLENFLKFIDETNSYFINARIRAEKNVDGMHVNVDQDQIIIDGSFSDVRKRKIEGEYRSLACDYPLPDINCIR